MDNKLPKKIIKETTMSDMIENTNERREGMGEVKKMLGVMDEKLDGVRLEVNRLTTQLRGNGTKGVFQRVEDNENKIDKLKIVYGSLIGGGVVVSVVLPYILNKLFS